MHFWRKVVNFIDQWGHQFTPTDTCHVYMQYIEQIATIDMNWYRKIIDIQDTNYAYTENLAAVAV